MSIQHRASSFQSTMNRRRGRRLGVALFRRPWTDASVVAPPSSHAYDAAALDENRLSILVAPRIQTNNALNAERLLPRPKSYAT